MRVTIIGHGPSIENAELSSFIDNNSDYVVRISKSHLSYNSLRHGNRTDYVCTSNNASKHVLKGLKPLYETWMYFPYIITDIKARMEELWTKGFNPVVCNEEIKPWLLRYKYLNDNWKKIYLRKGDRVIYSHFSIGMAAIIISVQRIEDVSELVLVGFDNLVKGSRDNFVSLSRKRKSNTSGHNYAVERQLLDEIVSELGVKLITK